MASAEAPVPDRILSILTQGMAHVPIIPVSSTAELVTRLDVLRRQCTANVPRQSHAQEMAEVRALASHCVHGQALSHERVNVLTDISSGLGSLAQLAFDREGRRKLCDLLEDEEGNRVISFFVNGHETTLRLEMRMREQAAQAPRNLQMGSANL
ncbi:uncharacterized protein TrAFT101_003471 [Trichoderma asperellum]|uniref:Uncharacterized protein n=1 Tax=Trichoderma asperellum (strain ATCC 204424 / CBS 433.97 / NBRC 101777) TaxID=1042311 RepID=A0A2T3ZQK3_TRIA4|nr:hypothetical protein M441DRAFT_53767 [Trichoderma asperellum CBS 433.97]PTB47092.1 hypothetical protein M441DRAFT_53767 [Trichoderma asperellum CBS 433.97]UKZ87698.1 hypothetical protein TrAFT101_003471 [Trichoderma asperellum]